MICRLVSRCEALRRYRATRLALPAPSNAPVIWSKIKIEELCAHSPSFSLAVAVP